MKSSLERELRVEHVLEYCDGPLLFIAEDKAEAKYICTFLRTLEHATEFLCTRTGPKRLNLFLSGEIDLLSLIKDSPLPEHFLLRTTNDDVPLMAVPVDLSEVYASLLPAPDYFVDPIMVPRELRDSRVVITASIDLSEARDAPVISSSTLGWFLLIFQDLFKNAYKKGISHLPTARRKLVSGPDFYTIQVADMGLHASFGLVFQSKQTADLLHHIEFEKATDRLAAIFDATSSVSKVVEALRANKGRLVNSYKRFLEFLIEEHAGVRIQWYAPHPDSAVERYKITAEQAELIREELSKHKDIEDEVVDIVGVLTAVNCETGSWTLTDDEAEKHKGDILSGLEIRLSHLVTDSVRYVFHCKEEVVEDRLGTETRRLYLLRPPVEAPPIPTETSSSPTS